MSTMTLLALLAPVTSHSSQATAWGGRLRGMRVGDDFINFDGVILASARNKTIWKIIKEGDDSLHKQECQAIIPNK